MLQRDRPGSQPRPAVAIDRTDELTAVVEDLRAAGKLSHRQAQNLRRYSTAARVQAVESLDALLDRNVLGAARDLAAAHRQIEAFDAAADRLALDATDRARLDAAILAVRDALGVAVADFLALDLTAAPSGAVFLPGDTAAVTVRLVNPGRPHRSRRTA